MNHNNVNFCHRRNDTSRNKKCRTNSCKATTKHQIFHLFAWLDICYCVWVVSCVDNGWIHTVSTWANTSIHDRCKACQGHRVDGQRPRTGTKNGHWTRHHNGTSRSLHRPNRPFIRLCLLSSLQSFAPEPPQMCLCVNLGEDSFGNDVSVDWAKAGSRGGQPEAQHTIVYDIWYMIYDIWYMLEIILCQAARATAWTV